MLEDGELSAIIGTGTPEAFGRNPDIVRLYPGLSRRRNGIL